MRWREREAAIESARRVLAIESRAVAQLAEKLGSGFAEAVDLIFNSRGKVILTGMGKSGLIGRKIAATMSSTGTPAHFLHSGEGMHGDLGMIAKGDVVVAISNSGETEELLRIVPVVKRFGLPLIVLAGSMESTLAQAGDVVIDVSVEEEACPLGLSPTASTTATLAMGDALALALLERRGFQTKDFALRHPGGSLGRRLFLKVEDLMHQGDAIPLVGESVPMKQAIVEMTTKRLGITGVQDGRGRLVGVITDGDLRRGLEQVPDLLQKSAREVMTRNPKSIGPEELAEAALNVLESYSITSLFVLRSPKRPPVGIVHLHDILRAKVA